MTNEIDIVKQAVIQYDKAVKIKNLNEQLYDQLVGSIVWILKYSERYNIELPMRAELYDMLERSQRLIENILVTNEGR